MKTKLKPYNSSLYTPHKREVLKPGDLVILLDSPRGYCGLVKSHRADQTVIVSLLDDPEATPLKFSVSSLIYTGKTWKDLLSLYEPSDQELSHSLEVERSIPQEWKDKPKKQRKSRSSKSKPRSKKPMSKKRLVKLLDSDYGRKLLEDLIKGSTK